MQPSVWGPTLWRSLHFVALGYPDSCADEATRDMVRYDYKNFFENFWRVLPCKKCSVNYRRHLEELPPIDNYLSCSNNLFSWTVALHNIVNKELGKREYTVEEAREFYKGSISPPDSIVVPAPSIRIYDDGVSTTTPPARTPSHLNLITQNLTIMSLILIIIILIVFIVTNKRNVV